MGAPRRTCDGQARRKSKVQGQGGVRGSVTTRSLRPLRTSSENFPALLRTSL